MTFHKTRIAPTPSGYLHLGNAFSFALTTALAKKHGASVLLRIDDLDQDRVEERFVSDIFECLEFLSIPWDEGPRSVLDFQRRFAQIHRMDLYGEALETLRDKDMVYACTCSRSMIQRESREGIYPGTCRHKAIPLDQPDAAWRLNTDGAGPVPINALQGVSEVSFPPEMSDFIVKRRDGFPAYQLASVIDDVHYGVDLVVRGEDLFPSTVAQLYLAQALGLHAFNDITFHHHGLIMEKDDQKLSKSAGATSIQFLRKQGKKAPEVYAMMARIMGLKGKVNSWESLGAAAGI